MIPKIIHYCWFGGGPKSDLIKNCIASWQKNLSGYEIREWSEKDFHLLEHNRYVRQAYNQKKWAFVSDVFRLYALYTEGGIYLDTDVEIKKDFGDCLSLDFFIGAEKYQTSKTIGSAVIGASPRNKIIGEMLELYKDLDFVLPNGTLNTLPNTTRLREVFNRYGVTNVYTDAEPIRITDNAYIFSSGLFCLDTPQSIAVHHFEGSWVEDWKCRKHIKLNLAGGKSLNLYRYKKIKETDKFCYPELMTHKLLDFNYAKKSRKLLLTINRSKFVSNQFLHHLENKVSKYKRKLKNSQTRTKAHIFLWLLKNLFISRHPKYKTKNDGKIHIHITLDGGIGDIVISLNFLQQFKKYFGEDVLLYVRTPNHSPEILKTLLYRQDFIYKSENIKGEPCDLAFNLIRFPDITYANLDKIYQLSTKLADWIKLVLDFQQTHSYCVKAGTVSDFLLEKFSLSEGRNREQQPDIHHFINVKTQYNIELENDNETLKNLGLEKQKYILMQRGVGPADNLKGAFSTRLWSLESYQKLAVMFKQKYPQYKIVQINQSIDNAITAADICIDKPLSFSEMMSVIKNAELLICQEGGMAHFRHYMGQKKSVVLFGPTNINFYSYPENINVSAQVCDGCEWLIHNWRSYCIKSQTGALCQQNLTPQFVFQKITENFNAR